MNPIETGRLRSIGMTPMCEQRIRQALTDASAEDAPAIREPMRLVEVHRETLRLHDGAREHTARVVPRLVRSLAECGAALAVGDWVLALRDADGGACWVQRRVPPLTHLVRRDGDGRRHALASNVDTALLVMGLDDDFNLQRLERYLVLVQAAGVLPVVVLSKADTATAERVADAAEQLRRRIDPAIDRVSVDARSPDAAARLAPYLGAGQTLVLLGSSGAGKSTLTNTLLGAPVQDTGAVRENDGRGKHTTTSRSLHLLAGGACVIDTPGLRTLRADVDAAGLAASFADIDALARHCRFRDCRHRDEPGCAVRDGVAPERLRNFHKMLREARRDTLTFLERRRIVAEWKSRGRAGHARAKAKRAESDAASTHESQPREFAPWPYADAPDAGRPNFLR